jgi:hypothetical protein
MRRRFPRARGLRAVLLTLPLAVAVEVPQDSSLTQIRVAGGGGNYLSVVRDCDGNAISKSDETFGDLAVEVDHKFKGSPVSLGVGGGFLHDGRYPSGEGSYYVNPTLGFGWERFGLSAGVVYLTDGLLNPDDDELLPDQDDEEYVPSVAFRFGRTTGPYLSTSLFSSFPFYSDGGYFDMGIGGAATPNLGLWFGMSGLGLTATAGAARLEWKMSDRFYFTGGLTIGQREGEMQAGGNIGITYRVIH